MHKHFRFDHDGKLHLLPTSHQEARINFLQEELDEFMIAWEDESLPDAIDALVDLVVVAYGTAVMMGVTPALWEELWADVHRANCGKERGVNPNRAQEGDAEGHDLVKPPGWEPPRTLDILNSMNWL
jgi:hypothetical protein